MKKKLNALKPGARFIYGGVDWALLELTGNEAICIASDVVLCGRGFDNYNKNNWRESSLRKELNSTFPDGLIKEGADPAAFVPFESDLTSDDNMKDFGTTWDIIALISRDLYRKYRFFIPQIDRWWWTLTPWSCDPKNACCVCAVTADGRMGDASAYGGGGGVRPICHLRSDILVSVPSERFEQAIGDMMKILNPYPKELWGEIMGALVAYACRE